MALVRSGKIDTGETAVVQPGVTQEHYVEIWLKLAPVSSADNEINICLGYRPLPDVRITASRSGGVPRISC